MRPCPETQTPNRIKSGRKQLKQTARFICDCVCGLCAALRAETLTRMFKNFLRLFSLISSPPCAFMAFTCAWHLIRRSSLTVLTNRTQIPAAKPYSDPWISTNAISKSGREILSRSVASHEMQRMICFRPAVRLLLHGVVLVAHSVSPSICTGAAFAMRGSLIASPECNQPGNRGTVRSTAGVHNSAEWKKNPRDNNVIPTGYKSPAQFYSFGIHLENKYYLPKAERLSALIQ